jgi:CubicO group peptidase (beta-lactamase class C family)
MAHVEGGESAGFSFHDVLRFHRDTDLENWDDGGEIMRYAFQRMPEFFPHAVIQRDGPILHLAEDWRDDVARRPVRTSLGALPLDDYVTAGPVNGIVIVHRGRIVFERYPRMRRQDSHISMSVSKVFTSTLIALLEARGLLAITDPVEQYVPELRGSGWAGVTIRDILDMASGIDCDQTQPDVYTNPATRYYQFEASLGWLPPTAETPLSTYDYVASLGRLKAPGQAFDYSSANTFVLAWLAEQLTGLAYSDLLSQEIWSRIGAEGDAFISTSRSGATTVHGGVSTRPRDMARFGLQFTPAGRALSDARLVSDRYLRAIQHGGRPELFERGVTGQRLIQELAPYRPRHNTYQWDWVMSDGTFYKGGYGGQGLLVSPERDLVVAFFGSFAEDGRGNDLMSASYQLAISGLFD